MGMLSECFLYNRHTVDLLKMGCGPESKSYIFPMLIVEQVFLTADLLAVGQRVEVIFSHVDC